MKIDRLMGIVVYLLNHGRTSARALSGEFEVSPRTIMRDLDALDQAGIPIQSFCGVDGGYQIMESFVLERQAATSQEYGWIVAALKGMASAYAGKGLEQALAKIESLGHPARGEGPGIRVDLGVASEDERINGQLRLLERAIEKKCMVRFSYTNSHDEKKEIQVEPVCVQYKWYSWYLIGYYEKYQDYCMFKLVRMEDLCETDSKNTKNHNISDIRMRESSEKMVHVRLYGKAAIKARCREYLNGRITKEYENGDFEFCFSAPEHEAFWYGVVLSFGSKARIIEPTEIEKRITDTCKEILREYQNDAQKKTWDDA